MKSRDNIIAFAMIGLVVLAGCGQQPNHQVTESDIHASTVAPDSSPTPTKTRTQTITDTPPPQVNPETPSQEFGELTVYNMTDSKRSKLNDTMQNFFHKLPSNKSERMDIVAATANKSCQNLTKINTSVLEKSDEGRRQLFRLYHAAITINEHYNSDISPDRINSIIDTSRSVAKYATAIGAYNNYVDASCAFDRNDPETVEDYYIATAALGLELALIQYQMSYTVASKATRVASHSKAFRAIQATLGDDALRIVMSETHWLVRGSLDGAPRFISEQAQERNLSLTVDSYNSKSVRSKLKEAYDVNSSLSNRLSEAMNESSSGRKLECTRSTVNSNLDDAIEAAKQIEKITRDGKVEVSEFSGFSPNFKFDLLKCLNET